MLVLAVAAIVGLIAFLELRFSTVSQADSQAQVAQPTTGEKIEEPDVGAADAEKAKETPKSTQDKPAKSESSEANQDQKASSLGNEVVSIAAKEKKFDRAAEITGPTGYINTDGISLESPPG